jgi:hypothetical protein
VLTVHRILAVAFLVIGAVLLVETAAAGGGPASAGYLAGAVFVLLGALRWRAARTRG